MGLAIILGAVLTPIYTRQLDRRVGRPNGTTLSEMQELVLLRLGALEERATVAAQRAEDSAHLAAEAAAIGRTTAGMVEALGAQLAAHIAQTDAPTAAADPLKGWDDRYTGT